MELPLARTHPNVKLGFFFEPCLLRVYGGRGVQGTGYAASANRVNHRHGTQPIMNTKTKV